MILSDQIIIKKLQNQEIKIQPTPQPAQIQPAGIDLTLGAEYLKPISTEEALDTRNNEPKYQPINANAIIIPAGEFVLGTTKEWVEIPPDLIGRVEGRSSIARLGIQIECAGFVDNGFKGKITLEIKNLSGQNIILYENMRICQIIFEETYTPNRLYGECGNKYQGQDTVTGSLLYFDDDNKPQGLK